MVLLRYFTAIPPYEHESRVSKDVYEFEMSREDHEELLGVRVRLRESSC